LRSLAELPDDMRRSVPALAFGGSVYSEIAAQRMVIFNGQVLREGDPLSDEVMLEQIRPRSAVLRLRGQRFEVPF
jgi:general secretion pathway protein B